MKEPTFVKTLRRYYQPGLDGCLLVCFFPQAVIYYLQ